PGARPPDRPPGARELSRDRRGRLLRREPAVGHRRSRRGSERLHGRAAALRSHHPDPRTMIIASRFNGPPGSANGGYACGLFSEALGGGFEVTLLVPPPLDTQLDIVGDELRHGVVVVARARRAVHSDEEVAVPVSLAEAEAATKRYAGFEHHASPTCFPW